LVTTACTAVPAPLVPRIVHSSLLLTSTAAVTPTCQVDAAWTSRSAALRASVHLAATEYSSCTIDPGEPGCDRTLRGLSATHHGLR
jgi:hypothetical protein